jgi:hypothetical protein
MGDPMTEQQMIADGWRRCAVGQRETQHCGLVEEARAQERARIRALVQALRDEWIRGYGYCGIDLDINVKKAFHEVLTLLEEGTSHA